MINPGILAMSGFRLVGMLFFAKTNLDRSVLILGQSFHLDNFYRPSLKHGHGDDFAVLGEHLGHIQFFSEYKLGHRFLIGVFPDEKSWFRPGKARVGIKKPFRSQSVSET